MALFKKRHEAPDAALTFLTASAADDFRAVAGEVFADLGVEVTIHPDHAVASGRWEFGFWNVAAVCSERPHSEWRGLIDAHLRRAIDSMQGPSPFDELDRAEAHYRAYARLYDAGSVPALDNYPHQEFAPGIVEMLALDLPDAVAVFKHDDARTFGGFGALRDSGIANLRQLPVEQLETVPTEGGGSFHLLLGDSVYTASRALLLPALATDLVQESPTEWGWLMSVPNRHQVAWHVVKDDTVVHAVNAMARFTVLGYQDSPGTVSPHLYWWNGTTYEQLTRFDDDGQLTIEVSPRFQAVVEAVPRS